MRLSKRIAASLLGIVMLFGVITAAPFEVSAAETVQSVGASSGVTGECTWTLDDNGVLTISGNGAMESYSSSASLPWGTNIKSVVIENGVTGIGNYAFSDCAALTSVTVSDSVTRIGSSAFYNTAWYNAKPDGLVYAGKVAYKYKGTMPSGTSVTLKSGTKGVGGSAFYNCEGLKSVTIPASVTNIGVSAFYNCESLTDVRISDLAAWCEIDFPSGTSNPLCYADSLFVNNERVTDIVIPEGTTRIGDYAFKGFSGITGVVIPDSVTSIGIYAFDSCECLRTVTLGLGITEIGDYLFTGCSSLSSLIIPEGVTKIGDYAFSGSGLRKVYIPDSVTVISFRAFGNVSYFVIYCCNGSYAELYARQNGYKCFVLDYNYKRLDDGTVELTNYIGEEKDVAVPDSFFGRKVSSLGNWLFDYCGEIESVELPECLTNIGEGAFYNCHSIKTVITGGKVRTIGANAFEKCIHLEQINLGSKLETIGDEAFYDCRRLKALDIPATVTSIGEEAFTNCRSLQSLVIPKGVQKLGDSNSVGFGMFENCKSLKEITIPSTVRSIQSNAFDGCDNVTIIGPTCCLAREFAAENGLPYNAVISESVGDTNCNGTIDIGDVTVIQRTLAEFDAPQGDYSERADADGNGVLDIKDATRLQMYIAEFDVELGR